MIPTRYKHALLSLLLVGVAYLAYAHAVVPIVEPAFIPNRSKSAAVNFSNYESPTVRYRELIKPHFPLHPANTAQ